MSRRKSAEKRVIEPDPRYNSVLATKFINCMTLDGKKSLCRRVFYDALEAIQTKIPEENPFNVFQQAVEKDPAYSLAYASLADSFNTLGFWGWLAPKEAFPKARSFAKKDLEIDSTLAEAHN